MVVPCPHSVWDGQDLIDRIGPLWGEKDEAKRIDGWKAEDRHIADNALVIPLLQCMQPILFGGGCGGDAACVRGAVAASYEMGARAERPGDFASLGPSAEYLDQDEGRGIALP